MPAETRGGQPRRARWFQRVVRVQVILAAVAVFAVAVLGWVYLATQLIIED